MRNRSERLDPKVFTLAANLFGINKIDETAAKKVSNDQFIKTAASGTAEGRIMAVYPAITNEAFALTMDNYRLYIAKYNFKTKAENIQIHDYNQNVDLFLKKNTLTPSQIAVRNFIIAKHKSATSREYNTEVEKANNECGLILRKRKIQTVKYQTELIFQNMLSLYNRQIMKRNTQYISLRVTVPRPLEAMVASSWRIECMQRNGVQSLDLCRKTIRTHRQRLEEAGVFTDYHFTSSYRPVELQINTDILVVFDLHTNKMTLAENQRVTPSEGKVLPEVKENTRTNKKEYEIKGTASECFDKEFPPVTPSICFLQEHQQQGAKKDIPPAAADVNFSENFVKSQIATGFPPPTEGQPITISKFTALNSPKASNPEPDSLSSKLARTIIHPQELAVRLTAHEFDNYEPIDIRILYKEAFNGVLTREEFREIVLQDFFKNSAKIWRNRNVFVGSWKNFINMYYENKFIGYNNAAFNKYTLVDDIEELRWRLEHARKWFVKNTEVTSLFPSQYFDFTRTTKREVGFEFTATAWKKHKKHLETAEARKKKREASATRRKEEGNNVKKYQEQIRRFLNNKITMPQLFDYVERNLPIEFSSKLPETILKMQTSALKKSTIQ